jgi:hypothetical protein
VLVELYEETLLTCLSQCSGNFADGDFEDHEMSEASTVLRLGQAGDGLLTLFFSGAFVPDPKASRLKQSTSRSSHLQHDLYATNIRSVLRRTHFDVSISRLARIEQMFSSIATSHSQSIVSKHCSL